VERAGEVLRTVDGMLLPHGYLADLPHTDLYEDRWVCLVSTGSRWATGGLTRERLAEVPWAMTYHGPTGSVPAAIQLRLLGIEPRVQVMVESFLALSRVIEGTDWVAMVPQHLAPHLTSTGSVLTLPCPFEPVTLVQALWWHPINASDPAHIWFRHTVAEACRSIGTTTGRGGSVTGQTVGRRVATVMRGS
jgi:DNA-binding transcriptional LysR family regulator